MAVDLLNIKGLNELDEGPIVMLILFPSDSDAIRQCFRRVIAGLDPAIHHLRKSLCSCSLTRPMDGRVKPGHDESLFHRPL